MVCEQSFLKITLSEYHFQIYLNRPEHSEGKKSIIESPRTSYYWKTRKNQQLFPPQIPDRYFDVSNGWVLVNFFLPNFQDILVTPTRAG
jgi:hypothetical protein